MKLRCVNNNCNCNKNNECMSPYLYVDCFNFEEYEKESFLELYLKKWGSGCDMCCLDCYIDCNKCKCSCLTWNKYCYECKMEEEEHDKRK